MSYSHNVQRNELDVFESSVIDESFSNDDNSNDFNESLINNSMPSKLQNAQRNSDLSPVHKTRSGLKYSKLKENGTLKRVASSASCSFTDETVTAVPAKILMPSDSVSSMVCDEWINPTITTGDREDTAQDVTQDVEDDEDDVMDYDEDYQTETQDSAVSSPQTSTSKYKTPSSSTKKFVEESVIDENSLISSTLTCDLEANIFVNSSTVEDNSGFVDKFIAVKPLTTESVPTSTSHNTESKPMYTRQMRARIRTQNLRVSKCITKPKNLESKNSINMLKETVSQQESTIFLIPRYPLRSRVRLEKVKSRVRESVQGSKSLDMLPVEIYYRIFQYLPIQDLFRIQRVNRRFKQSVERHLCMVKRINFSCGLPFAFLPDCLNDTVLKRILFKTPEVTHILGFYPRKIEDVPGLNFSLTYSGIMSALRQCNKLRSVEIMDLELMSRIVHALGRVKFHGMFRNRPYSWEDEYVNPFINKSASTSSISSSTSGSSVYQIMDSPTPSTSSSSCSKFTSSSKVAALKSLFSLASLKQPKSVFTNFVTYSWMSFLDKMTYTPIGSGLPLLQPINQGAVTNFVTPIPSAHEKLMIPHLINNLTKLDLVSVCIHHLPRLENIKYLHLKWVRFSSPDPFAGFQAPKIQSFVMNNCIGPMRGIRYVRIFSALSRANQLNRLELVSTRIVEGLFETFFPDLEQGPRSFRNLQRLVLASNKEFAEVDVAALMLSSAACLNHLALSVSHARNSLMLALANAGVVMQKLESVIMGYQDPFQSMLTGVEIHTMGLHDSPDHTLPVCKITDRGVAALMQIAPKLISLHLRHAVFVEDPSMWVPRRWTRPQAASSSTTTTDSDEMIPFPLKSLTLENCPGIKPEAVSHILNHASSAFPQLEMLVLRDMFAPLPPSGPTQATVTLMSSLSCRAGHQHPQSSSSSSLNTALLEGLSDRHGFLYPIVAPGNGTVQTEPQPPLPPPYTADHMDQPLPPPQLSRFFVPGTDFRLSEMATGAGTAGVTGGTGSAGSFGMSSQGFALMGSAQVLGAQHTNLGASIRPNEYLRQAAVAAALRGICQLHRLNGLGLSQLAMLPATAAAAGGTPSSTDTDQISSRAHKRKRARTLSEKTASLSDGFLFHSSAVPSLHRATTATNKEFSRSGGQEKPMKRRKLVPEKALLSSGACGSPDFVSSGTQTCVCGHLDWLEASWQREVLISCEEIQTASVVASSSPSQAVAGCSRATSYSQHRGAKIHSSGSAALGLHGRLGILNVASLGCKLCSFPIDNDNHPSTMSMSQPEPLLEHRPREWIAQDASTDTASLRLHVPPQFYPLELRQNSFAHLTTLHMEKVGITHLVLISCHRLKSITLENCPELQTIVINTGSAPPSDSMPGLRRLRIMRCPKFAIYNLLYQVTRFYPQHDDNLYITYRPFGEYNALVEKALWLNSDSQHVMVSHEYRQNSSERNLEELCSSFDQLFREMLNFSESLIRRDILTVSDFSQVNNFTNGSFLRSEHGSDWDLMTDIPWISEVCCSMLPSDLSRSQQADQLYELLSEIQSHLGHMKLRRRGIHLHVQFRDVHMPSPSANSSCSLGEIESDFSYLVQPYTDSYLASVHPATDHNARHSLPDPATLFPGYFSAAEAPIFAESASYQLPAHVRRLMFDPETGAACGRSAGVRPRLGSDMPEKVPIPHTLPASGQERQTGLCRQPTATPDTGGTSQSTELAAVTKIHKFRSSNLLAFKKDSSSGGDPSCKRQQ